MSEIFCWLELSGQLIWDTVNWNCTHNWFRRRSIIWNCPNNWFWILSINWNCPYFYWCRRRSTSWNCRDNWFRRRSINWNCPDNSFWTESINWNCPDHWIRRLPINWSCLNNWLWEFRSMELVWTIGWGGGLLIWIVWTIELDAFQLSGIRDHNRQSIAIFVGNYY